MRRRPTARMNACGTCALAAHGWAPLLAIVARWCADVRRRAAHGTQALAARCRPSCRALAAQLTRRRPACCAPLAARLRLWSLDDVRWLADRCAPFRAIWPAAAATLGVSSARWWCDVGRAMAQRWALVARAAATSFSCGGGAAAGRRSGESPAMS
ncbi:hypothetical protein F511_46289 [Dorcoceras hygrometricum]|uniref:Uncharacterized protein n=1 Tax=Dorcoceras hygrometricum TaxID=472368 RepID=A0A2Z6ZTW5_9LAMI|nr:hypothetical protein F511_46289 [Dorcoceras hygrometricum]